MIRKKRREQSFFFSSSTKAIVLKLKVMSARFRINTAYREDAKLLAKSYWGFKIFHRLKGKLENNVEEKCHKAVNTLILPLASENP